jgi:phage portal protein BeeE
MSWWERLLGRKEARALTELPNFAIWPDAKSGVAVNWITALQVATVFACTRALAEGIAQVPCSVYQRRDPGPGADEARKHPLYWLLHRRPNPWQTSFEFRETVMMHLVLCGNAYVFKNMVGSGADRRVHELIPIPPGNVSVTRRPDMTLSYRVAFEDGAASRELPADAIWHLRGPSWNSWMGLEPVRMAREAIGLSLALEESHALLAKNGGQTTGTYSVEGELNHPEVRRPVEVDPQPHLRAQQAQAADPGPRRHVGDQPDDRRRRRAPFHPQAPDRGDLPLHADLPADGRPRRRPDADLRQRRAVLHRPRHPQSRAVGGADRGVGRHQPAL